MLYVFIGCLTFGVVFSIMSALFGGHGAGHDGIGHGGGDAHVHSGADSAEVPSPFNPLVISSAITAFGAVGLITKTGFGMGDLLSSVVSLGFAGITGAALFFGVVKFMYGSQSNSVFSQQDLVGTEAEVTTPIPLNGMGEIAYVINGVRYNMTARADEAFGRGTAVIIREVSGNAALVQKKITLDDLDSLQTNEEKPRKTIEN